MSRRLGLVLAGAGLAGLGLALRRSSTRSARRLDSRAPAPNSGTAETGATAADPAPHEDDESYAGPAVVRTGDRKLAVEVHLSGHFEPIDGRFHWYGRIAADADITALLHGGSRDVTLGVEGRHDSPARLAELDPWGNVRVTGAGRPPYRRD